MKETWIPSIQFGDLYEVSSLGRVRALKDRRGTKAGTVLKPRITKDGYVKVVLRNSPEHRAWFVHRLVYASFIGVTCDEVQIDHIDGDKQNNSIINLEAVSRLVNMRRSFDNGRNVARGSSAGLAKLTECDVAKIKRRLALGEQHNKIALDFSISPTTVGRIAAGRTWAHVSPSP